MAISISPGDQPRPVVSHMRLRAIAASKGMTVRCYVSAVVAVFTAEVNYIDTVLELLQDEYEFWAQMEMGPNARAKVIRRRERRIDQLTEAIEALKAVAP